MVHLPYPPWYTLRYTPPWLYLPVTPWVYHPGYTSLLHPGYTFCVYHLGIPSCVYHLGIPPCVYHLGILQDCHTPPGIPLRTVIHRLVYLPVCVCHPGYTSLCVYATLGIPLGRLKTVMRRRSTLLASRN